MNLRQELNDLSMFNGILQNMPYNNKKTLICTAIPKEKGCFGNPLGKGSNCKKQSMLCTRSVRRERFKNNEILEYFRLVNLEKLEMTRERKEKAKQKLLTK